MQFATCSAAKIIVRLWRDVMPASGPVVLNAIKPLIANYLWQRYPALWLEHRLRHRENFEPEFWLAPLFCRKDRIAVDVGANMGEYSYYMAKFARTVIAFEPNLDLWPHLRLLLGGRARLEGAALSKASGAAAFRYVEDNAGVATIEGRNKLAMLADHRKIKTREVEMRPLDSYGLTDVSFIKIDVEGHEEAVVEGARATLAQNRPVLLIESENRHNPGSPQRLAALLEDLGYAGFYLKHGKLYLVDSIAEADRDAANLSAAGRIYINNYLFVPESQLGLIGHLRGEGAG